MVLRWRRQLEIESNALTGGYKIKNGQMGEYTSIKKDHKILSSCWGEQ